MAASLRHQWRDTICGDGAYGCILGYGDSISFTYAGKQEFGIRVKRARVHYWDLYSGISIPPLHYKMFRSDFGYVAIIEDLHLVIEGPETVEVTTKNKVVIAEKKLKEARSRQKSYADHHQRALKFKTEDIVFLKVSPCKGVRHCDLKGKLSPRFICPFKLLDRVGEVSYRLALSPQLSHVHNVFHISPLRGYNYHPLHVILYLLGYTVWVSLAGDGSSLGLGLNLGARVRTCVRSCFQVPSVVLSGENSGRLAKWAIELGEHDIRYKPRSAMKGQVVADFIAESSIKMRPKISEEATTSPTQIPDKTPLWTLFIDRASSSEGSGAGLILTNSDREEITYALRFEFPASNNEAEYEALIAGLELAIKMEVRHLQVFSDSLLVTKHVKGSYKAREESMKRYLTKVLHLQENFERFSITQVPRSRNRHADALSKLASSSFAHLTKKVLVKVIQCRSTEATAINVINESEVTWMSAIVEYLKDGKLPDDPIAARRIRIKAPQYSLKSGILYRKGYLAPWLRCIGPNQAQYILQEVHFGSCGTHAEARTIAQKAARLGYYWPTMYQDATHIIITCRNCQEHAPILRKPQYDMTSIYSPWPFYKWGIDIVGHFPEAPGKVKFLVVAIDYFTKWVEAAPLATITGKNILKFVWTNIMCRFGISGIIVSDNGKQFSENPFRDWCSELNIKQQFTSVAHPQANGQTGVTNRTLLQGLKTRLGKSKGQWVEELSNMLWAYRTTTKAGNNCTPFSLVYGSEAVLPPELGIPTYRISSYDENKNNEELRLNLEFLEERRSITRGRWLFLSNNPNFPSSNQPRPF
ncbi:reverse transcriptase domain-containing protein [Tanacetum coccineum]